METTLRSRVLHAYKTEAQWTSLDPVLKSGEMAFSSDKYGYYKLGNGTSKWSQLPYVIASDNDFTDDDKEKLGELNTYYGTCETAQATASKTVSSVTGVNSNFKLVTGATIRVKFTYANNASSPTLNVCGTGAKNIKKVGTTASMEYMWQAGEVVEFVYDGTNYVMTKGGLGTTTYYGLVKLSSSTSSSSTSLAATPSAVKSAYDLANTANNGLSGKVDKVDGKELSSNDFTDTLLSKLNGIDEGANKYVLPVAGTAIGGVKSGTDITVDSSGNVSVNDDSHNHIIGNVDGLQDALDAKVDAVDGKGLSTNDFTTTLKNKLDGIAQGAEVNQNAFATVKVGSTSLTADAKSDTLTITAGSNITLTPTASSDSFTIAAKDTTYTPASAAPKNVGTAAVGTSDKYAREDHVHSIALATGDSNGQVKIAGTNIDVKGLGSAAYTDSSDYAASGHNHDSIYLKTGGVGTAIPSNAELDDYQTPGTYHSLNSTTSKTLKHTPVTGSGFIMYVTCGYITTRVVQTVIDNSNDMFRRYFNGSSWTAWAQVYDTVNKPSKSDIGLGNVENKSSATIRGELTKANVTNALSYTPAELDSNGFVLSSQLPSYVDDVVEGYLNNSKFYKESAHTTEITGEASKIYVDLSTNKTYRWSGSAFTEISASLALGETSSTAYRGDRGKTAYDHSQKTSGNPHKVTKADVGLGNVDNTSDADKPISTATQTALDATHNASNITEGVLPAQRGGTGKTTLKDAANDLINALDTGSSTPVDADYYISQYVKGGTTTTTYHRRPMSALWSYIKGKTDAQYLKLSGGTLTGDLKLGTSTQSTLPSAGITIHDIRSVEDTPAWGDKTANFYFTQSRSPDTTKWWSVFRMRGWTGGYSDWEIAGPANNTDQSSQALYVRTSNTNTAWGSWRKIYDTSNKPTASDVGALSTSGGEVTGTLVLSKNTDLSGTANNSPALIVGGKATEAHIEIDPNEIQAKSNGTTATGLNLNVDGGNVSITKKGYHTWLSGNCHVIAVELPEQTAPAVGWYRVAYISGYGNYIMFHNGGWSYGQPSNLSVGINVDYNDVYIKQLYGLKREVFTKLRLVKSSNGQYYLDAYQSYSYTGDQKRSQQRFVFVGATGSITVYTPTEPVAGDATAAASCDLRDMKDAITLSITDGIKTGDPVTLDFSNNLSLPLPESYVPLTGGTMSGELVVSKAGGTAVSVVGTGTNAHTVALHVNASGVGGLYDTTHSKWIVSSDKSGNVSLNGNASTADTASYLKVQSSNEMNFKNVSGAKTGLWFNYRDGDTWAKDANDPTVTYTFGNYNGKYDKVTVRAGAFDGKATSAGKLHTAVEIDGVSFDGSADITHYGTCTTGASTQAKVVTCAGFKLVTGARIHVKFTNAQTYNGQVTLNVNSTGAKNVCQRGTTASVRYEWNAGEVIGFIYDGTNWIIENGGVATGTYYGKTKLNASLSSTSTVLAATPSAINALRHMLHNLPGYSSSQTYAVGDRVYHDTDVYECNTAITAAEDWTAAHWTKLDPLQTQLDNVVNGTTSGTFAGTFNGQIYATNEGSQNPISGTLATFFAGTVDTGYKTVSHNGSLMYHYRNGKDSSSKGYAILQLGNGSNSSAAGGTQGYLRIYGEGTTFSQLTTRNPSSSINIYLPAIDGELLSLNGAQTVTGEKTFNGSNTFNGQNYIKNTNFIVEGSVTKGTNPSGACYKELIVLDSSGDKTWNATTHKRLAMLSFATYNSSGNTAASLVAYKNSATEGSSAVLAAIYDKANNVAYATAPTYTGLTDNSTKIVTTAYLRNIFRTGTAAATTSNCPNGCFYFKYS